MPSFIPNASLRRGEIIVHPLREFSAGFLAASIYVSGKRKNYTFENLSVVKVFVSEVT